MVGQTLLHYEILAELGAGAMGRVYRARDTKLGREIALKVLPPEVAADPSRLERFRREAETLASLSHPEIVTIHAVEECRGVHFLAMELVEGTTLGERIPKGGLPLDRFWPLATALAEAVGAAHRKGVVHRDIKPGNVMVTDDGRLKVLDFGLSRLVRNVPEGSEVPTVTASLTAPGTVLGTLAYMSPEQVQGRPADRRSDVFSLGAVLYQMLTGRRPFEGDSQLAVAAALLQSEPPLLGSQRPDLPPELEAILTRCLEKDPAARFADAEELSAAVSKAAAATRAESRRALRRWSRPAVVLVLLGAALLLAGVSLWLVRLGAGARRARGDLLPRAEQLLDEHRFVEAFQVAQEARRWLPDDPALERLIRRVSAPVSLDSEPPGASVELRDYLDTEGSWQALGVTPLKNVRIPARNLRIRFTTDGYEPLEVEGTPFAPERFYRFAAVGGEHRGMVWVPEGPVRVGERELELDGFWIDRHEVTNEEFQAFVDAGGYDEAAWWREPIVVDGAPLEWEAARELFRDATGRPGPAGWRLGRYPEGEADLPVAGLSWFEAAAYARWAGKRLPTVYQWRRAAGTGLFDGILRLSNFDSDGPAPAGSHRGVGPWGTVDMAGNVREWCRNAVGSGRALLGGAWGEPRYMFTDLVARSPLDRGRRSGFRCVRQETPNPAASEEPIERIRYDFAAVQPAPDALYRAYRSVYDYDPRPLDARVESVDDTAPYWREEFVSYRAAYGQDRVLARLYLPRESAPPYQTVVFCPGSGALRFESSEDASTLSLIDFIPRSGRALLFPVFEETYERNTEAEPRSEGPNAVRELIVHWAQDLGRSVDYLVTRDDIDRDRLAFVGLSFGAEYGPIYLATEGRFRTAVLLSGGFDAAHMPSEPEEIHPWHFAPHVRLPVLMVNGRDDFIFPVEESQDPLFQLLGTPAAEKRHAVLPGGHVADLDAVIRETLDWLDRYLGPVGAPAAP